MYTQYLFYFLNTSYIKASQNINQHTLKYYNTLFNNKYNIFIKKQWEEFFSCFILGKPGEEYIFNRHFKDHIVGISG